MLCYRKYCLRMMAVLCFVLVAMPLTGWGQTRATKTICEGTETNEYVPFYGWFADAYQKCEFVIPSTTTGMSDLTGKIITKMIFYVSSYSNEYYGGPSTGTFRVFLYEISESIHTTFLADTHLSNVHDVYTGTLNVSASGLEVTFDSDKYYSYGGGNLLIGFHESSHGSGYAHVDFYGVSSSRTTVQGYSSSGLSDCSLTARDFLPKITFTYTTSGPANSTCATATNLSCGTSGLAGTTMGTPGNAHGTGASVSNYGVWYTFTGDGGETTISTTAGSGYDHRLVICSGSCSSLTNLYSIDNAASGGTESKTFTTVNGTTYYVYIAHYSSNSSTTGTFTISRTCPPPANFTCATATSLPCGTSNLAGTTVNTTGTAHGLPSSASLSNYGVWYTFTGDDRPTTISVHATGYDSEIAIVSGSCGNFTWIGYNDSGNSTQSDDTYTFTTTSGTTYYVYVAYYAPSGTSSNTGTFNISRTCVTNHTVTLNSWPTSIGATFTGGGSYAAGSHTITATAPSGYQFVNWTDTGGNVVSHNASYTFNLSGDVTYQANFTKTTATSLPWTEGFESYSGVQLLNGEWATPLRFGELPRVVTYYPTSGTYSLEVRQKTSNY